MFKPAFKLSRLFLISLVFLLLALSTNSQQATWGLNIGSTGVDYAQHSHLDASGNAYFCGEFSGANVDFDPSPSGTALHSSNGLGDGFVAKYTTNGQYLLSITIGGSNIDKVEAVCTDASGNIYISGFFRGANVDFDPSPSTSYLMTSNGDAGGDPGYGGDIFLAKYTSTGQFVWAFHIGGSLLGDDGLIVKPDASGNLYVGGYFAGPVDFDPSASSAILNSNSGTAFLAKYNSNGQYQWAFNLGAPDISNAIFDLVLDPANNVYITGYFQGSNIDFDPSAATAPLSSAGSYEAFVAKYTSAGQYLFAFKMGGGGMDVGRGITLDNSSNIYVVGDFQGTNIDFDPSVSVNNLSSNGNSDVFLGKYTSNGQYTWAFNAGSGGNEICWNVATDNTNVFITGGFSGIADFNPSAAVDNLTSNGGWDIFLGKYLADGTYQCAFGIGSSGDDFGVDIEIAGNDRFYLAGGFLGNNIDFTPTPSTYFLNSNGNRDAFLVKYFWPPNTLPTGTVTGNTICPGQPAQFTFNALTGTSPFTLIYSDGTNSYTQTNVQSGVPFNLQVNPTVTTTYTVTLVQDAVRCSPQNTSPGITATITVTTCNVVTASFTAPDTVCVNSPVNITNTSANATTNYWNFCVADINAPPVGTNLGNVGGLLNRPVYIDYVFEGGNYYGFLTNNTPQKLLRLNFGNSLLNTPTVTDLGTVGGSLPNNLEGLQIVKNEGKWYVIIVGGETPFSNPSIVRIELGTSITNNSPVGTNWGNLGNLAYPHDLYVFSENGNWYGFTVNYGNNTVTRFDFTTSFSNVPIATNLGNIGNLSGPTGLHPIKDNNNWYLFVTNATSNTLTRLNFGSSLLSTPTGQNLGNINGTFHTVWDIYIMRYCGKIVGFAINGNQSFNDLIKLDFGNNLLSTPTAVSLGNIGNMLFPHCISKIFRVGPDLYSFVPNVDNNTLTRLRFTGCTNSSIPNSNAQNPPPVTYNAPGTYNINLTVDDGLPTQSAYCKQVVVLNCVDTVIINDYTPVISFDPCKNIINVGNGSAFNVGDTVLTIQMKGAVIDSTNTSSFGTITNYKNAGNYEFNYVKSKNGNSIELLNKMTRQYDLPNGKVQLIRVPYFQNYSVPDTIALSCLPWNGSVGGVLVFNVQNTLTLNGNIDVSGRGFSGGRVINTNLNATNCYTNNYFYPNGTPIAAGKGESIASISNNISSGKGASASAGGGGNDHNSGGGGGGNATGGGFGGYQLYECNNTFFDNRGIGGRGLLYNNASNKIFMGGGGGAGHCNNGFVTPTENTNYNGGNGGGIVLISANTITANNYSIISRGDSAFERNSAGGETHDGMGGGGAGGTVLVSVNSYTNNLNINVKGGKGGDMHASMAGGHIGPGGGGAGGVVWFQQAAIPSNITINNSGGRGGYLLQENNNPYGTTGGSAGTNVFSLQVQIDNILFKPNIDSVRIKDSLKTCTDFDFKGLAYTNTNPISTWQWYFGDGGTANTQNTSHTYTPGNYTVKLIVTDLNGCKDSITRNVIASALTVNAGNDTTICGGQSVTLQATTNGGTQFQWNNSSLLNNSTILNPVATPPVGMTTTFIITATNIAGCSKFDTVNILVKAQNTFSINAPSPICPNGSAQLIAQGGDTYQWSPSSGINSTIPNPVVNPTTTTIYTVLITDTLCNQTQNLSTQVVVLQLPNVQAFKQNDIDCMQASARLNATGAVSYKWSPSASLNNPNISNPTATPTANTIYIVEGTDAAGCKNTDTISVMVDFSIKNGLFLVPNAFTPNNDGLNDCFGVKHWGVLEELDFNVYNRWGELIFHTKDATKCWDGNWKGKQQDPAVFVYWIKAKSICGGDIFRKGTVVLIR